MNIQVSELDKKHYVLIRENVSNFIKNASIVWDKSNHTILDVAPEIHKGAAEHFKKATIKTLDIDPKSTADYIADLCNDNSKIICDESFEAIICTEVLEHTENPFLVAKELLRMTKKGGSIYVSVPFNFRIHGPLPDNWRFTVHGIKNLFKEARSVEVEEISTEGRDLMPVHYTAIISK